LKLNFALWFQFIKKGFPARKTISELRQKTVLIFKNHRKEAENNWERFIPQ